jgi:hypothetical protein
VRDWRQTFEYPFPIDAWDPVARFVRDTLGWDWPQVWFFTFLIYGPLEKLLVPYLGGYLVLGGPIANWRPDIEALLTGFVEFPFFFAFYIWTGRGIGNLFVSLARNKSFSDEQRYATFLQKAQSAFDRWWWPALSFGIACIIVLIMHFVNWAPNSSLPPWWIDGGLTARLLSLFLIGCVAYAFVQVLIREILAVFWLQRLWNEMGEDLVVHPYHVDRAGGLGAIGQHAANLAVFVMMIMLFIIMATLLPTLRTTQPVALWSPLISLIWVLYFLIVPSIFYLLIWPPHKTMVKVCTTRLNAIASQIEQQLAAAEMNASDYSKLPKILEHIKNLKTVHAELADDLPGWPINARVQRQLRLSVLLPVIYSLITLAIDLLK